VTTYFAFLRGINVTGNNMMRMADLKALCTSLGFRDVQTVLQSGNVLFRARRATAKQIEDAVGVRVMLRTEAELREVVANNPFEPVRNPSQLLVAFLERDAPADAEARLRNAYKGPDAFHVGRRELYCDYLEGLGKSKLTHTLLERTLGMAATMRNWNTVTRLLSL